MDTTTTYDIATTDTAPQNGAIKKQTIHIKVTQERYEQITYGEFLAIDEGGLRATGEFIARFLMRSDGVYHEHEEAMEILLKLTMPQITNITEDIKLQIDDIVAKKKNAST